MQYFFKTITVIAALIFFSLMGAFFLLKGGSGLVIGSIIILMGVIVAVLIAKAD